MDDSRHNPQAAMDGLEIGHTSQGLCFCFQRNIGTPLNCTRAIATSLFTAANIILEQYRTAQNPFWTRAIATSLFTASNIILEQHTTTQDPMWIRVVGWPLAAKVGISAALEWKIFNPPVA
jgi:hypothetical protein